MGGELQKTAATAGQIGGQLSRSFCTLVRESWWERHGTRRQRRQMARCDDSTPTQIAPQTTHTHRGDFRDTVGKQRQGAIPLYCMVSRRERNHERNHDRISHHDYILASLSYPLLCSLNTLTVPLGRVSGRRSG